MASHLDQLGRLDRLAITGRQLKRQDVRRIEHDGQSLTSTMKSQAGPVHISPRKPRSCRCMQSCKLENNHHRTNRGAPGLPEFLTLTPEEFTTCPGFLTVAEPF